MKKLVIAAVASAFIVAPAFAGKVTVSFADDSGETRVVTFDDSTMMATESGVESPYTFDPEAGKLCATVETKEICVTFAEVLPEPAVGDTSAFTTNTGGSGIATITAVE